MDLNDEVWLKHRESFAGLYDDSNYKSPLQSSVMRESHKLAEKAFGTSANFNRVLEIGAGTGEHYPYVRHSFKEYVLSDSDPRILNIAKEKLSGLDRKVIYDTQTGERLTYDDNTFDRVLAIHVLEHIYQPHIALKEWYRVLKGGGVLSVLIPTDPGMAWRLGRNLGPRRRVVSKGIEYDYLMAREHVNSCNNLIAILRHLFPEAKEAWWPFPIPSTDLNLFFVYHAYIRKGEGSL